ncbi:MAG: hypothetical protein WBL67_02155 [Nitrososphaeraceae archaeon]
MMFHSRILQESATEIVADLCTITNDEEATSRQITLQSTFEKGFNGEEIEGAPKLAELIAKKVDGQDLVSATLLLYDLKNIWQTDDKAKQQHQQQRTQHQKSKAGKEEVDKNRYEYVQRYSDDTLLAEGIIVDKKPRFAVIRAGIGDVTLEKEIPLNDEKKTVLRPQDLESYINKPYVFKSEKEFYDYVDRAKGEDLDSLYSRVKTIWQEPTVMSQTGTLR